MMELHDFKNVEKISGAEIPEHAKPKEFVYRDGRRDPIVLSFEKDDEKITVSEIRYYTKNGLSDPLTGCSFALKMHRFDRLDFAIIARVKKSPAPASASPVQS